MVRQYNDKWGAVNRGDGQTIQWQMRSNKSKRWLLFCHCIVCPSLRFTAPHLPLYCLSVSPNYCSSFVIVLSVHLSDLLLLICYCIVCPSLRFTAPDLLLYCLSFSPIYFSSFVILLSVHFSDFLLLICHCIVCPSLWFTAPWTDNTMTNEV
jgi:hypothetical protein